MNFKMIGRIFAPILAVEAAFMLPALLICLVDGDLHAAYSFVCTIAIIAVTAAGLWAWCRKAPKGFRAREGLICVGSSWVLVSLFGCLPFVLSGQIPNFIDALFEIVSGFTTTGASIVPQVENLSRGILYWRSFSHWLGGMGILVFILAIVPVSRRSGGFTLHLLRAESPGPNVVKLVPHMKKTAAILYLLYILLTLINFLFLLFGKMPWFDALCTTFGTAGTGGFGIKSDSMAGYSPYIQNVCTVFMMLFGVNFSCYYLLLIRQFRSVLKDEELRLYLMILLGSTLLITWNICDYYTNLGEAFRQAAFQVSSIMTTTGFATTDFNQWPNFSKSILLCLMFAGACSGSTGGGIKCGRIVLLLKSLRRSIQKLLHPQAVHVVRMNRQVIDENILESTNVYLAAYVLIVISSFILISIDGFSLTTNFSAVLSCFNNIGPGLELVGPASNYASYSAFSKFVLIVDMLAGRLEIYPILVLFFGAARGRIE